MFQHIAIYNGENLEQPIANIRLGISKLQKLYENSAEQVQQLTQKNKELTERIAELEALHVSDSNQKVMHNIADAALTTADKKEMKQTINALVREVDKCIALLNQ